MIAQVRLPTEFDNEYVVELWGKYVLSHHTVNGSVKVLHTMLGVLCCYIM